MLFVPSWQLPQLLIDQLLWNLKNVMTLLIVQHMCALSGGKTIEEEMVAFCNKNIRPISGQVFSTGPGKLQNFSTIVHAVLEPWTSGGHVEQNILYEAIFQSLSLAANMNMLTIAVIGIGSGFPASISCSVVAEVVKDFLQDSKFSFREITLFDTSDQVINHFHENLGRLFGKGNVHVMDGPSPSSATPATRPSTLPTSAPCEQLVILSYFGNTVDCLAISDDF